jgi:hypothetical protein
MYRPGNPPIPPGLADTMAVQKSPRAKRYFIVVEVR